MTDSVRVRNKCTMNMERVKYCVELEDIARSLANVINTRSSYGCVENAIVHAFYDGAQLVMPCPDGTEFSKLCHDPHREVASMHILDMEGRWGSSATAMLAALLARSICELMFLFLLPFPFFRSNTFVLGGCHSAPIHPQKWTHPLCGLCEKENEIKNISGQAGALTLSAKPPEPRFPTPRRSSRLPLSISPHESRFQWCYFRKKIEIHRLANP